MSLGTEISVASSCAEGMNIDGLFMSLEATKIIAQGKAKGRNPGRATQRITGQHDPRQRLSVQFERDVDLFFHFDFSKGESDVADR